MSALTAAQRDALALLRALAADLGPVTAAELAVVAATDAGGDRTPEGTAQTLASLVRRGYAERASRRPVRFAPTPAGLALDLPAPQTSL